MLDPKDASSNSLPCSANNLHWEQPCAISSLSPNTMKNNTAKTIHFFILQKYHFYSLSFHQSEEFIGKIHLDLLELKTP